MEKLFTVAGTAVSPCGKNRVCFATGTVARRKYKLEWHGCTDVKLHQLPEPMTREAATAWVAAQAVPVKLSFSQRMAAAKAAKKAAAAAAMQAG